MFFLGSFRIVEVCDKGQRRDAKLRRWAAEMGQRSEALSYRWMKVCGYTQSNRLARNDGKPIPTKSTPSYSDKLKLGCLYVVQYVFGGFATTTSDFCIIPAQSSLPAFPNSLLFSS